MKSDKQLFYLMEGQSIKCPVCGKSDLEEYDICDFCNWENDMQQYNSPDIGGGANDMSLNEAREAWKKGEPIY